jgi:hypothetical protein
MFDNGTECCSSSTAIQQVTLEPNNFGKSSNLVLNLFSRLTYLFASPERFVKIHSQTIIDDISNIPSARASKVEQRKRPRASLEMPFDPRCYDI